MINAIINREEWELRLTEIGKRFPCTADLTETEAVRCALWELSPREEGLGQRVLSLCQPFLNPAEPEEWLLTLYHNMTLRLFPEEGQAQPVFTPEETAYLCLLDLVLAHRPEDFDPLLDVLTLEEEAIPGSRVEVQYRRFLDMEEEEHILALFYLGRELMPFDPASHTIGVHNVALHIARMASRAGLEVDLPLVRAAAFGHDIGKFGCRGADARRIPYLHYYFTWQWFSERGMEDIGYISANHSTWDLEFENLPMESLLLIYADFRVRGTRDETGKEVMSIYSLSESYEMIFSKLYDMTPEKQKRYETVYDKLQDFEHYLHRNGVPTELSQETIAPADRRDPALLHAEEALQGLKDMVLSNSVKLMGMVSTNETFVQLLEQTKREKSQPSVRTYLHLLEEYSTYLTAENKRKTLSLLYELLMHPEGDVRRTAGQLMGQILANSGPKYRKERPLAARKGSATPAMMALLEGAVNLWKQYIHLCLSPDRKLSEKHAQRISNSLKVICGSLFAHCDEKEIAPMLEPLLQEVWRAEEEHRFVLVDTLYRVPWHCFGEDDLIRTIRCLGDMLAEGDLSLRLAVLRCFEQLQTVRPETVAVIEAQLYRLKVRPGWDGVVLQSILCRLRGENPGELTPVQVSDIFLSDLKNAVPWMEKLAQISMLADHVARCPEDAFHTGMHMSNLLSVSEHLPVREHAGKQLLNICPYLTVPQMNEIAIDLLRELESGQEQISRFIPPYLGKILSSLPEREFSEAILQLERLVQETAPRPARAALYTLGEILSVAEKADIANRVLGILMTGICHYEGTIHRTAMTVLCKDVFGNETIPLTRRRDYFVLLHKKLLTILSEPLEDELTFFSRAAMLNHLYRFMIRCQVELGGFSFSGGKPVAFFPGTFDPFSVGHKRIVEEIRERGFEVYLAVDEFSWSKRTLAKLRRRKIVEMSVADQWDTYLFPDDIPINIASPEDLAHLNRIMEGKNLYLVAGDDVICNASAYRDSRPGSAAEYNHIVFAREGNREEQQEKLRPLIRGELELLSLPNFYESVSSTRIRNYVDQGLDISMLVAPMVQSYIYSFGLYVRTPESKQVLRRQDMYFRNYRGGAYELPQRMNDCFRKRNGLGTVLRCRPDTLLGWAVGRTMGAADLYDVLHSLEGANFVRQHTSGRIFVVEQVVAEGMPGQERAVCRMLLNELLVRSLESDHTFALCRCERENSPLRYALEQLGFVPVEGQEDFCYVDMRSPVMLLQDVLLKIKMPHRDSEAVKQAVAEIRPRLRRTLARLFPGKLVLCFDSELLNQALMERIQQLNGVDEVPAGIRQLGPYMCVPYGKILADEVVPNTVTKTLRVEKRFSTDIRNFEVVEYPGYSPLKNQIRTLKSFRRPVILVDDLLHRGYRIEKLDRLLREENLSAQRLIVGVMSGYGRDLMKVQNRQVDSEYFIPNLHYWVTESLLYPFIGGDSVAGDGYTGRYLPSINLILPYFYPNHFRDVDDTMVWELSRVALENAHLLLRTLEEEHQRSQYTALTIEHLEEVLFQPRLPDRGKCTKYDMTLSPSEYLRDDLARLEKICWKEEKQYDL